METAHEKEKRWNLLLGFLMVLLLIPGRALLMLCSKMFAIDDLVIDGSSDSIGSPYGYGPQGDVIRIDNMVCCVRAAK